MLVTLKGIYVGTSNQRPFLRLAQVPNPLQKLRNASLKHSVLKLRSYSFLLRNWCFISHWSQVSKLPHWIHWNYMGRILKEISWFRWNPASCLTVNLTGTIPHIVYHWVILPGPNLTFHLPDNSDMSPQLIHLTGTQSLLMSSSGIMKKSVSFCRHSMHLVITSLGRVLVEIHSSSSAKDRWVV